MGDTGLEPGDVSGCPDKGLRDSANRRAAESGAVGATSPATDPDLVRLQQIVDAWPTLPEAVKASVCDIVRTATEGGHHD